MPSAALRRTAISILTELADALRAGRGVGSVHETVLQGAVELTGAERVAVLIASDGGSFDTVAASDAADLSHRLVIGQLSSPIWQAVLGRGVLRWGDDGSDTPVGRPLPFAGAPGWKHLVAVGMPLRGARQGLLVVGADTCRFNDDTVRELETLAALSGFALDNLALAGDFRTLGQLLTSAVGVTARTVDAQSPDEIRQIMLEGLVKDMGMDGAVLWEPAPGADGLALTKAVGLPPDVTDRLAFLPPSSMAYKLYEQRMNVRLMRSATARASSSWPGMRVRLVRVGHPSPGVLGVYTAERLPDYVDEVLASLSQALSRAVHQTTLHQRTQQMADALVRELRPSSTAAPPDLQVGYVYRSATRGIAIGGDFLDWFSTDSGHFGVACGDVSGKGVEAASLTAMVVYSLRAFALRGTTPQVVLSMLNNAVCDQTPPERFATLAYARVEPGSGAILLGLAGHPPPVLVHGDTSHVLTLAADVPVGLITEESFSQHSLQLEPGDSLVLVTDGVTEARRGGDEGGAELLGERGLVELLSGRAGASAQELADAVWSGVMRWTGGGTTDDCAIVVVKRR